MDRRNAVTGLVFAITPTTAPDQCIADCECIYTEKMWMETKLNHKIRRLWADNWEHLERRRHRHSTPAPSPLLSSHQWTSVQSLYGSRSALSRPSATNSIEICVQLKIRCRCCCCTLFAQNGYYHLANKNKDYIQFVQSIAKWCDALINACIGGICFRWTVHLALAIYGRKYLPNQFRWRPITVWRHPFVRSFSVITRTYVLRPGLMNNVQRPTITIPVINFQSAAARPDG